MHPLKEVLEERAGAPVATSRDALREAASKVFNEDSPFESAAAGVVVVGGCLFVFAAIFGGIAYSAAGPFGLLFGLIPAVMGVVVIFMMVRNSIAQKKLGPVTVEISPDAIVEPGTKIAVSIAFTPTTEVKLNSLDVTLRGQEQVVSGSGSNKTTHTHEILEEMTTLCTDTEYREGDAQLFEANFTIPEDAPYTFKASCNEISWAIKVHVDIPMWPDWVRDHNLIVYPIGQESGDDPVDVPSKVLSAKIVTEPSAKIAPLLAPKPDPVPMASLGAPLAPIAAELAPEPAAPVPEPVAAVATGDFADLPGIVERLAKANFTSEREKIVAEVAGQAFSLTIIASAVESTSSFDASGDMKDGKTLIGKVEGLDREVAVQVSKRKSEDIGFSVKDEVFTLQATLIGWKSLYDRPLFEDRS
jgi:hypothetical protein